MFARQELARKQFEQMQQQKEADAAAEARRIALMEAEWKAKMPIIRPSSSTTSATPKLTPLIKPVPISSRLYPRSITPISNMVAIQKAKAKVEQIKAARIQTVSKTAPKTTGRVAHVNKDVIEVHTFLITIAIAAFNFIVYFFAEISTDTTGS